MKVETTIFSRFSKDYHQYKYSESKELRIKGHTILQDGDEYHIINNTTNSLEFSVWVVGKCNRLFVERIHHLTDTSISTKMFFHLLEKLKYMTGDIRDIPGGFWGNRIQELQGCKGYDHLRIGTKVIVCFGDIECAEIFRSCCS